MTEEINDKTSSEEDSENPDETSAQSGGEGDPAEDAAETTETAETAETGDASEATEDEPSEDAPGAEEDDPEARIAELEDKLLRSRADMENMRSRLTREMDEKAKYAATALARDILTAADNLQRALDCISPEAREQDEALENFAAGVEAIEREMLAAFGNHNIRKIEPVDEKFNPEFHQAMFEVENTGRAPGTVVEVVQPGYLLHDRLLRPAMVGVAKGEPSEESVDTKV
ncbi:MAG: nucleotide exchange factor GrpE [Alphaproteobacteria bacterium]|nr:nucleotide exchange factor GrpE [Alphaproteobacteria bacterium]